MDDNSALDSVSYARSEGSRGNTYAQDALRTNDLDQLVLDGTDGVTLGIGLDVAQVTNVTDLIGGSTVSLAEGVVVRTGGGAAVGVVTELVDVHTTLGVGVVAGDVPRDGGRGGFVGLLESDSAGDLGVTTENSDWTSRSAGGFVSFPHSGSIFDNHNKYNIKNSFRVSDLIGSDLIRRSSSTQQIRGNTTTITIQRPVERDSPLAA